MSRSLYNDNGEYIYNSCHCYERAKERGVLNRKSAEQFIGLARARGIGYEECTRFMDKRYLMDRTTDNKKAVAYNGFGFIFNSETLECITIFNLPKDFGKKKTYHNSDNRGRFEELERRY